MANIHDISFEDIELFLAGNNLSVPKNIDDVYNKAFNLFKKGNMEFYPDSVVEWMMAYNVIQSKIKIQTYKKSYILSLSRKDIRELASLLGMKNDNIDHILNILRFLHKLDDDSKDLKKEKLIFDPFKSYREIQNTIQNVPLGILEYLPDEKIIDILDVSDFDDITILCNTSKLLNNICNSYIGTQEMRDKFPKDSLDISKFTISELAYYSKILPLKKKIGILGNEVDVLLNDKLFIINTLSNIPHKEDFAVNQVIFYLDPNSKKRHYLALTFNGILISDEDIKMNLNISEKVICISGPYNDNITIFTSTGKSYLLSLKNYTISKIGIRNIIQMEGQYILTGNGDLYIMSDDGYLNFYKQGHSRIKLTELGEISKNKKFLKLPKLPKDIKIVQITATGFFLTDKGTIYVLNFDEIPLKGYNWETLSFALGELNNIIKISSGDIPINSNQETISFVFIKKGHKQIGYVKQIKRNAIRGSFNIRDYSLVIGKHTNNVMEFSTDGTMLVSFTDNYKLRVQKNIMETNRLYELDKL
jgi:hypothetical protein